MVCVGRTFFCLHNAPNGLDTQITIQAVEDRLSRYLAVAHRTAALARSSLGALRINYNARRHGQGTRPRPRCAGCCSASIDHAATGVHAARHASGIARDAAGLAFDAADVYSCMGFCALHTRTRATHIIYGCKCATRQARLDGRDKSATMSATRHTMGRRRQDQLKPSVGRTGAIPFVLSAYPSLAAAAASSTGARATSTPRKQTRAPSPPRQTLGVPAYETLERRSE